MSAPQIVVRIGPDGAVTAETRNVTGAACLDYVGLLEDLLDATTVDSSYTADYTADHTADHTRTRVTQVQEARDELGRG